MYCVAHPSSSVTQIRGFVYDPANPASKNRNDPAWLLPVGVMRSLLSVNVVDLNAGRSALQLPNCIWMSQQQSV